MQYFQNELQGLRMDNYHVGELIPMDHMSQYPVQFDSRLCGRCGGCGRLWRLLSLWRFAVFGCGGCFGVWLLWL